jgi:hypothetical protein
MSQETYAPGRVFIERLPYGGDLLQVLNAFCGEKKVAAGTLSVIGAVQKGSFVYYNQESKAYKAVLIDEEVEIISCLGNVSLLDGKPFVHAHISFARADGQTLSGHLAEGTILFAGELFLQEWLGPERRRAMDPQTGLNLWEKN